MADEIIALTVEGAAKLKKELEYRKNVKRPQITAAIAEAREHGDLSENAEYHAARELHSQNEAFIKDIEGKLSNCRIIDVTKLNNDGTVVFGSTVTFIGKKLEDEDEYEDYLDYDESDYADEDLSEYKIKNTYKLVGDDEADIAQKMISSNTPIGRALIGKKVGKFVPVKLPSGCFVYKIMKVEYI